MGSRVGPMAAALLTCVAACGGDAGAGGSSASTAETMAAATSGTMQPSAMSGASGAGPASGMKPANNTAASSAGRPGASASAGAGATMPNATAATGTAGTTAAASGSAGMGASAAAGAAPSAGATAGSAGAAGAVAGGDPASMEPTLPPITDPAMAGPFMARYVPTAEGLSSHALFVPSEQGLNGKNPVVVWTCGNGGTVTFYQGFLEHLASHGFFIVADKGSSSDRLAEVQSQNDAIAWVLEQNMSGDYSGKLDVDHIAVMGHSLGSLASFATAAMNEHVTASVHYSGGLTGNPVGFDMKWLADMTKPAAFLCGGNDTTAGPACADDFETAPAMLPVFYGVLKGVDHIGPFATSPRGGEYGRAGVAWLRWKLANDASYKPWFTGTDCKLCSGAWEGKQKNLE